MMKTVRSGIVEELKEKYKARLARAPRELKEDEKRMRRQCSYISDLLLFWKWAYRVGKGCYGFSLGHIPPVWTDVLDEFLSWVEAQCPDFEISWDCESQNHAHRVNGHGGINLDANKRRGRPRRTQCWL
jgi:hypothetical protein